MQRLKNVLAAYLLKAPEQVAGIIQHDAWIAALYVQLHLHGVGKDRADRVQSRRRSAWIHRLQVPQKTRISASRTAIGGRSSWLIREGLQGLRLSLEHREDQLIHSLSSTMGPAMGISAG